MTDDTGQTTVGAICHLSQVNCYMSAIDSLE